MAEIVHRYRCVGFSFINRYAYIDFTKRRFLLRSLSGKTLLLMSRVGSINRHIARSVIRNAICIELSAQHVFNHRVTLVLQLADKLSGLLGTCLLISSIMSCVTQFQNLTAEINYVINI